MKFTLKADKFEADLLAVGRQHVRVGMLDKNKRAMKPGRPLQKRQLIPGVPTNKATQAGRSKQARLAEVLAYLNRKRGILDEALEQAGQEEISEMAELFVKLVMEPGAGTLTVKKLENVVLAIVRNPIIRREYGPNAPATIEKKGFDRFGVNTGTLMKSIEAKYGSD